MSQRWCWDLCGGWGVPSLSKADTESTLTTNMSPQYENRDKWEKILHLPVFSHLRILRKWLNPPFLVIACYFSQPRQTQCGGHIDFRLLIPLLGSQSILSYSFRWFSDNIILQTIKTCHPLAAEIVIPIKLSRNGDTLHSSRDIISPVCLVKHEQQQKKIIIFLTFLLRSGMNHRFIIYGECCVTLFFLLF